MPEARISDAMHNVVTTLVQDAAAFTDFERVARRVLDRTGDALREMPAEEWSAAIPQLGAIVEDDDGEVVEQGDSTSDPEMVEAARRYLDDIYELYGASDRPEEDPEDDASGLMPFRY